MVLLIFKVYILLYVRRSLTLKYYALCTTEHFGVVHESQHKERLFPYTTLTDWVL